MTLDERLACVVEAARSKKAGHIRLLNVQNIASFADIFVFMSGSSDRQNRAIAEAIFEALKGLGERPVSQEGDKAGVWILMDYGDLIVHVMDENTRNHYKLEELWKAGSEIELPPDIASQP
ncbi:MAG: ribosome silencing factor [Holophagales bacterium]|jgi:ribosome-associated protein|nr:ribosome silencing factor [Holophagales bacterium]